MFHLTLETVCEKCTIIEAREIKKLQGHTACKLWTQDSNIDFQVPVILKQFIFSVSTNYKHSWVQGIQKNASKTIFTVQTLIIRESLPACIRPHSYNKPIKKKYYYHLLNTYITPGGLCWWLSSVQFSHSGMSNSLWPHGLQHARLPCPSPTPGAYSNSCPLSRWCHSTVSSSVVPFSSRQW